MTVTTHASGHSREAPPRPTASGCTGAGILNVWQYDDQVFELADGRLLLRGANGAGKSKTLEMLLPFVLDGDKQRMTASARHHTSLLWLMTRRVRGPDPGRLRVGGVRPARGRGGLHLRRRDPCVRVGADGHVWYFTMPAADRSTTCTLEDDAGPLVPSPAGGRGRRRAGTSSSRRRAYKQHVGPALVRACDPAQYDEVLRLLYWLRQPQVGEDIEPARLAEQLAQALPQLDDARRPGGR